MDATRLGVHKPLTRETRGQEHKERAKQLYLCSGTVNKNSMKVEHSTVYVPGVTRWVDPLSDYRALDLPYGSRRRPRLGYDGVDLSVNITKSVSPGFRKILGRQRYTCFTLGPDAPRHQGPRTSVLRAVPRTL